MPNSIPSADVLDPPGMPWIPLTDGLSVKPLRIHPADSGYVALLRLEPGAAIPLHRHTGEAHVVNLEGSRELSSGEIVGPGGYVYEPAGYIDSWRTFGDAPVVAFIALTGAVEYLDADGSVRLRANAALIEGLYHAYCTTNGVATVKLKD